MSAYNKIFYNSQENGSLNSAKEILPIIMDILDPKSVIDVGCGLGTWLSVFNELGVDTILGLDGNWVDKNRLLIPKENFIATDLENPINLEIKFDLAVSLEVAEHINPEYSEKFIEYLTEKAPVILFSAAIPHQGGTNHFNEQWPEYWINIFQKNNYQVIDCIRNRIWANNNIEAWYIQNIFLFVEKNYLSRNKKLRELGNNSIFPFSVVHPEVYFYQIRNLEKIIENQEKDYPNELQKQKEFYENLLKTQEKSYEEKLQSLNQFIQEMKSSKSWRWTEHLRKIGALLKKCIIKI